MAHYAAPKQGLGPAFWPATIAMTLLSAAWIWWLAITPFTNFLPEAALPADQIDELFKMLAMMGGAVFIYVFGYLLLFCVEFRERKTDAPNAIGIQLHDAPAVEIAFWVVPTLLIVVISWFSLVIWNGLQKSPGNALVVEAVGYQFGYDFRYPSLWKPVTGEFHLPVDTPVTVKVTARDVIHGFWIPEIRLKADMVPGLINTLRFTPIKTGTYRIVCTEFCGIAHGAMVGKFIIDTKADYEKWLTAQAKAEGPAPAADNAVIGAKAAAAKGGAGTTGIGMQSAANSTGGGGPKLASSGNADAGKAVFSAHCQACHSVGPYDQKIVGPGLGHLLNDPQHPNLVTGEKASTDAIVHILKNGYNGPLGQMPNQTANNISDKDIADVTAYLASLSK